MQTAGTDNIENRTAVISPLVLNWRSTGMEVGRICLALNFHLYSRIYSRGFPSGRTNPAGQIGL